MPSAWLNPLVTTEGSPNSNLGLRRSQKSATCRRSILLCRDIKETLLNFFCTREIAYRLAASLRILMSMKQREVDCAFLITPARFFLLARTSVSMEDRPAAENYLRRLYSLVSDGIDASHPTILAGHYEEAMLHLAAGEIPAARNSLEKVLDNRPLGHGLPALGAGHRLLVAAQREAPKVELQVSQEDDNRL